MFLVDTEKETIKKCDVLTKRQGYGYILLAEGTILCLPVEDNTHYLCYTLEEANAILYSGWFTPQ